MTEDTKRAIEAISPLAKLLGIGISTGGDNWILFDGQPIAIGENSDYATAHEFLGYCIYKWADWTNKKGLISPEMDKRIRSYWISPAAYRKLEQAKKAGKA